MRRMMSDAPSVSPADPVRVHDVIAALSEYRQARERLLAVLGHASNRDLPAEVAEHMVAALMGGTLAANPRSTDAPR